jgi:DNA repair helicase Rad25
VERAAREWGALVKASQSDQQEPHANNGGNITPLVSATHQSTDSAELQQQSMSSETELPAGAEANVGTSASASDSNTQKTNRTATDRKKQVFSFQIKQQSVEDVRRTALEMDYPLMEEYDFRRDTVNSPIPIELKPSTHIRSYQARSLSKMFGNGRARSGVIVLPCGAGKTLTGITACATISRSCVVLCNSGVAAQQWRAQLLQYTTIPMDRIARFTSKHKDHIHKDGCVLLTTYHMMAKMGRRSASAQASLRVIQAREWGLLILDEVHIAPARLFRQVLLSMKAHCKLGLTATLVREDEKIFDLNFLIGPKLYEANWLDLTDQGYLARVRCREVFCSMPSEFYAEYLQWGDHHHLQQLLYVLNPNKILAVEHLVQQHDARGDKTLVFCDNVLALRFYQHRLRCPLIFGATSEADRIRLLSQFRRSSVSNTLLISKVGDVALDLPEANVLIQVSSHYGSRRQEAQRLGRILRRKAGSQYRGGFNAFFYSLVSTDTSEMYYSGKRQQYLVDQGYYFEAVNNIEEIASVADTSNARADGASLRNKDEQLKLLREILMSYTARAAERDKQREEQHVAKVRRQQITEAKSAFAASLAVSEDHGGGMEQDEDESELADRWMTEEMEIARQQEQERDTAAAAAAAAAAQCQAQAEAERHQQAVAVRERERSRVVALRDRMTRGFDKNDAETTDRAIAVDDKDSAQDGIDEDARGESRRTGGVAKAKRTVTSTGGMAFMSGVGDMEYMEYSTNDD